MIFLLTIRRTIKILESNGCYKWWGNLLESQQYHILLDWFPQINLDTDIEKFWDRLSDSKKLWIYKKENENEK